MMDFWLNASDILENLDLEENSVVSQVIQVVEMIGDALSLEAAVDQVDPEATHSGGEGKPVRSITEHSGEDSAIITCDKDCSDDGQEGGRETQSLEMTVDREAQGEISHPVREPGSWAADATNTIEQEREEAGTAAKNHVWDVFVTSFGNNQSDNDHNETVLSGESSTSPTTDPRPELQTPTHTPTSVPETQTELPSFPPEVLTLKEPSETPAGLLTPFGSEAQSPVTPSELETPAEPAELEASPGLETPASETTSVETTLQLGQPAEAETLPEAEIAKLERSNLETPLVMESSPEQATPACESEPEAEVQTESEKHVEQEQASSPLEEEVTSMEETRQVTEKLTGQSRMEAGPGRKEEGSSQNTSSKEPEGGTEAEEEGGAHGGLPEKSPHSSQNDPSRPYGEMTPGNDEENHPNVSKYKTVSYRNIRKGNTKQRIDEFESIINA